MQEALLRLHDAAGVENARGVPHHGHDAAGDRRAALRPRAPRDLHRRVAAGAARRGRRGSAWSRTRRRSRSRSSSCSSASTPTSARCSCCASRSTTSSPRSPRSSGSAPPTPPDPQPRPPPRRRRAPALRPRPGRAARARRALPRRRPRRRHGRPRRDARARRRAGRRRRRQGALAARRRCAAPPQIARALVALRAAGRASGASTLEPALVNGQPGFRTVAPDGRLVNVVGDRRSRAASSAAIYSMLNPDKLGHLGPVSDLGLRPSVRPTPPA